MSAHCPETWYLKLWKCDLLDLWIFWVCKRSWLWLNTLGISKCPRKLPFFYQDLRTSSSSCVHLGILFVLVFVVYCGCLTVESEPSTAWKIFMWFGFLDFISSVFERFLVVLQHPKQVFFTNTIFDGQRRKKDRRTLNGCRGSSWCLRILAIS